MGTYCLMNIDSLLHLQITPKCPGDNDARVTALCHSVTSVTNEKAALAAASMFPLMAIFITGISTWSWPARISIDVWLPTAKGQDKLPCKSGNLVI